MFWLPGNLDNYNNDRMKVELDSNFAKPLLQKYLNYKKKFIQASANADDPTQSKEVLQYRRLAEQYLKQYAVQGRYSSLILLHNWRVSNINSCHRGTRR